MSALRTAALKSVKVASIVTDPLAGGARPGPRILIYHQVGADSGLEMDVTRDEFARQLEWTLETGRVLRLEDAVGSEDPDAYVFTFDDGHAGVYNHAFDLLAEHGAPFTLYLSSGPLEKGGLLHGDSRMPLLSWGQTAEMVDSGLVTIGSHSHEHLDMRQHSRDVIEADLIRCDEVIAERLGVEPQHFAYPWGQWSAEADGVVRDRYTSATVGSGPGITAETDHHRLPRVPVMLSDSPMMFRRKMWGGFRLETALRGLRDQLRS